MSAAPLIAGRLYRVCGLGLRLDIVADHGSTACAIGLAIALQRRAA